MSLILFQNCRIAHILNLLFCNQILLNEDFKIFFQNFQILINVITIHLFELQKGKHLHAKKTNITSHQIDSIMIKSNLLLMFLTNNFLFCFVFLLLQFLEFLDDLNKLRIWLQGIELELRLSQKGGTAGQFGVRGFLQT
jgi:hypothetical protein